jgi:hypothetical protein
MRAGPVTSSGAALYGRDTAPRIAADRQEARKFRSTVVDTTDMSATRTHLPPTSAASTDVLSAPQQPYTGPDRRRNPRHPHFVAATLQPADGNTDLNEQVLVCNLSLGGAGILCDRRYAVDSVWRLTLGNGPLFLNAKVSIRSCRPRPDGRFDVGCQFC